MKQNKNLKKNDKTHPIEQTQQKFYNSTTPGAEFSSIRLAKFLAKLKVG